MSPGTAGLALAQVALAIAVGWSAGRLLMKAGSRSDDVGESIGLPERGLAAAVGFVAVSVVLSIANIAAGGAVFGSPAPVPIAAALLLVAGVRRRGGPRAVPWLRVTGFGAVLFVVFLVPSFVGGTSVRGGDPPWHLGWSEQLLGGDSVPTGPAPQFARNAYPWGFHGVIATLVRLVPGSDPLVAHEALQIVFVVAIPLAAACLARRIDVRSGWGAAAAVSLIGGFGWIAAGGPAFDTAPRSARFGADLVVASPNSVYEMFPPAFPRELGLVLVAAAGIWVAAARQTPAWRAGIAAGVVLGLAGLVSLPMLVTGGAWIAAGAVVSDRHRRFRLLAGAAVGVLATMSVWLAPVIFDYIRYGGFVDVTPRLGVEWPLPTALWSWGLLGPLAVAGVVLASRIGQPSARLLLAFGAGSVIVLALAVARGKFGWELGGNATMLHQGRAWPPVHLLAAAFGGVALLAAYDRISARSRHAALACAVLVAVGAISPAFASVNLTETIENMEGGFVYARSDLGRDSFARRVGRRLDPGDVVLVEGSDDFAWMVFQFSGARLAEYDDEDMTGNDLRIRFAELARAWDERMAAGGFDADYVLVRAAEAPQEAEPLLTGEFGDPAETWVLLDGP